MFDKLRPSHTDFILQHIAYTRGKKVTLRREPETLSGGFRRSTYKLTTDQGSFVVSVGRPGAPISQQAHDLQIYLYEKGAPVAKPVGNIGTLSSGHQFQIVEFIAGKNGISSPSESFTQQDMEAFGKAIAKIHALSERYFKEKHVDPDHQGASWRRANELLRMVRVAEDFAVKKWLREGSSIPASIIRMTKELRQTATELPVRKFRSGITHRDTHLGNMIITDKGQVKIIDLESIGRGIPLQDIAFSMLWIAMRAQKEADKLHVSFDNEKAKAFLKGYESVKPLSPEEKQNIFEFIKIQAMSNATVSQMGGFNKEMTPDDYQQWSTEIGLWADRIAKSSNTWIRQ